MPRVRTNRSNLYFQYFKKFLLLSADLCLNFHSIKKYAFKIKPLLILICVVCFPVLVCGLELECDSLLEDSWLVISASVKLPGDVDLLATLEEGYESQIYFHFRLYEDIKGPLSLFGDKLVLSKTVSSTAYKNFFFNEFVIEDNTGNTEYYSESTAFLSAFLNLLKYRFYRTDRQALPDYYLLCEATLVPVKLESPLNLVLLFKKISLSSERITLYLNKKDNS